MVAEREVAAEGDRCVITAKFDMHGLSPLKQFN
jgi:hypothetical protein